MELNFITLSNIELENINGGFNFEYFIGGIVAIAAAVGCAGVIAALPVTAPALFAYAVALYGLGSWTVGVTSLVKSFM